MRSAPAGVAATSRSTRQLSRPAARASRASASIARLPAPRSGITTGKRASSSGCARPRRTYRGSSVAAPGAGSGLLDGNASSGAPSQSGTSSVASARSWAARSCCSAYWWTGVASSAYPSRACCAASTMAAAWRCSAAARSMLARRRPTAAHLPVHEGIPAPVREAASHVGGSPPTSAHGNNHADAAGREQDGEQDTEERERVAAPGRRGGCRCRYGRARAAARLQRRYVGGQGADDVEDAVPVLVVPAGRPGVDSGGFEAMDDFGGWHVWVLGANQGGGASDDRRSRTGSVGSHVLPMESCGDDVYRGGREVYLGSGDGQVGVLSVLVYPRSGKDARISRRPSHCRITLGTIANGGDDNHIGCESILNGWWPLIARMTTRGDADYLCAMLYCPGDRAP